MIIDAISDLHGHYPKLEGGDLLIVAGDLTARDEQEQLDEYYEWQGSQLDKYDQIIFISGNHDNLLQKNCYYDLGGRIEYLYDSGINFKGLKIWGSPWTKTFEGMNPKCKAFTCDTEEELDQKFSLIPNDIDILVTHCPPFGIFDQVKKSSYTNEYTGSMFLRCKSMNIPTKLHVFGHIHEHGGKMVDCIMTKFVNASLVNEHYQPVNKPVRVIL